MSYKPPLAKEEIKKIVKLYRLGSSLPEIGRLFDRHHTTIQFHLIKHGIKRRPDAPKGKKNRFSRESNFQERHSASAGMKVQRALKDGSLKRPETCDSCGKKKVEKNGRTGIHAHHCDYNWPLLVMWLCRKCHFEWHLKYRAIPKCLSS